MIDQKRIHVGRNINSRNKNAFSGNAYFGIRPRPNFRTSRERKQTASGAHRLTVAYTNLEEQLFGLSAPQDSAVCVVHGRPAAERPVLLEANLVALIIDHPERNPAVIVTPQDVVIGAVQRRPAAERPVLLKVDLISLGIDPPQRNTAVSATPQDPSA
jgi:hypothetical protein